MNNQRGFIPLMIALVVVVLTVIVLVFLRIQKVNK